MVGTGASESGWGEAVDRGVKRGTGGSTLLRLVGGRFSD